MSFEYNGFIHRDLEPQVRYDAEQIQLLKQADVTINENLQTVNESLQTVNTEIDGKLTKPTNPSEESAVTMLANGTVGTKPLSEIGGSGGKLYRHFVSFNISQFYGQFYFYSTSSVKATADYLKDNFFTNKLFSCVGTDGITKALCILTFTGSEYEGYYFGYSDGSAYQSSLSNSALYSITDTVTEV